MADDLAETAALACSSNTGQLLTIMPRSNEQNRRQTPAIGDGRAHKRWGLPFQSAAVHDADALQRESTAVPGPQAASDSSVSQGHED